MKNKSMKLAVGLFLLISKLVVNGQQLQYNQFVTTAEGNTITSTSPLNVPTLNGGSLITAQQGTFTSGGETLLLGDQGNGQMNIVSFLSFSYMDFGANDSPHVIIKASDANEVFDFTPTSCDIDYIGGQNMIDANSDHVEIKNTTGDTIGFFKLGVSWIDESGDFMGAGWGAFTNQLFTPKITNPDGVSPITFGTPVDLSTGINFPINIPTNTTTLSAGTGVTIITNAQPQSFTITTSSVIYTGSTNIGTLATTLLININHTMPSTNYTPSISFISGALATGVSPSYSSLTTSSFVVNLSAGISGGEVLRWSVISAP